MTETTSFRPPWAVVTWCDDRFIYVEIPCNDGPSYIFKEALTEGGLSKVLHLMRDARRRQAPRITGDYNSVINAAVKYSRSKMTGHATEEQRESARKVLQGLGMLDRVARKPSKT